MKKFLLVLFSLSILCTSLFSQKSIHQLEYENHLSLNKESPFPETQNMKIIPLRNVNKNLTHFIYGYLPDWEYPSARYTLNYDLLTHISAFDFVVDANGNITAPSYWPWTDVINAAHSKGVKVIMTAVNFTQSSIHNLLTDQNAKQNFINKAIAIIKAYELDGINVDFEGLAVNDRGSLLNNFMSNLTDAIHYELPGKEVSFAGPAVNWGGWDLLGLANSCDYIFIMGYDFAGSWSTKTGAVAPLDPNPGSSISIRNTVEVQYSEVTNSKPNKLILGVPYYGQKWKTSDSLPHTSIVSYVSSTRFRDDALNSQTFGILWSTNTKSPWYRYQVDNSWYQVWFDNDSSLGLKYQLAKSKGFRGVGMWALGYDGSRPELWNELRKHFYYSTSSVANHNQIVNDFSLSQNYPNPFNPETNIKFYLNKNSFITLKVFDSFGRTVAILLNEYKLKGNYSVPFNAQLYSISSGVYFYSIISENFSDIKKMVYIK